MYSLSNVLLTQAVRITSIFRCSLLSETFSAVDLLLLRRHGKDVNQLVKIGSKIMKF